MSTPRVTVIIPTYNRAAYLGEAIGSVLGQSLGDFELIVVDDAQGDLPAAIAAMRPVAYENVYLFHGQRWLDAGALRRARREFLAALRVSETRPRTALRIVWFAIVIRKLACTWPGATLIARLTRLRRRWLREDAHGTRIHTTPCSEQLTAAPWREVTAENGRCRGGATRGSNAV